MTKAESMKALRERRREEGLCYICGSPPAEGKKRCQKCIDKDTAASRKHYAQRRAAGMCTLCGRRKGSRADRGMCQSCALKHANRCLETYHRQIGRRANATGGPDAERQS